MKLIFYRVLARLFNALEAWANRMHQRFSYCSSCGRNVFTGPPCMGKDGK